MKQKKKIPFEAIMTIVVLGLIAVMAIDGFAVEHMPADAAAYPIFVFVVIALAGVAELVNIFRRQKAGKEEKPVFENRTNFLIATGMIIGYAVVMYLIGFILSSILFTVLFVGKFKMKKPLLVDIGAAAVIVAVYFCFEKLLYIFLPSGILLEKLF